MNANTIGKTLVLLNLVFSAIFLSFALAIVTQQVDWGWKEPRDELGERVPAEIDKRSAAVKQLLLSKSKVEAELKATQEQLAKMLPHWQTNRIAYETELDRLENYEPKDPKETLDIHALLIKSGVPVLDPKTLRPQKVPAPIAENKSYIAYTKDLKDITLKIIATNKAVRDSLEEQGKITRKLSGVPDEGDIEGKGLFKTPGLYHLLDIEREKVKKLRAEIEYIRPKWVNELVDAQLLLERKVGLEERVQELQKLRKEKKVAAAK